MKPIEVEQYEGLSIFLEDGKFWAELENKQIIRAASLKQLKSKITPKSPSIKVILIDRWRFHPELVEIRSEGKRWRDVKSGHLLEKYATFYQYDAEIFTKLKQIQEQYQLMSVAYYELVGQLKVHREE